MKTEEIVKQFEGEMNKYHAEMKKYNSAMEKYHREEKKYLKAIDGRLHIELGIYKPQCFHGYVSFFIPEKIYKKVLAAYLQTQPDAAWIAKDRSSRLDMYEEANLTTIINKVLGE